MLTEKEKNIINAVCELKCVHIPSCSSVILKIKEDWKNKNRFFVAKSNHNTKVYTTICTIEEYNQCIDEMDRAPWLYKRNKNDIGCYSYYYYLEMCGQKGIDTSNNTLLVKDCDYSFYAKPLVYTQHQDINIDGYNSRQWKFGCYLLDKENCIVISDGAHMSIPVSYLSVKTHEQIQQEKEEAELQAAEHKQRKRVANILRTLPISASFDDAAEKLQRVGALAEILLPLEK